MSTQPSEPRRRLSIAQIGGQFPAVVRDAEEHGPVELTRDGEPVAMIVPLDEYRRLESNRPGFWDAIQKFRAETDLEELDIESAMHGVRDQSSGRDVEL